MPSVSPAKAPASFEVKSASLPLVGLLLKSAGLDALAADLRRYYGSTPDFFDHDPLLIDLSPLSWILPSCSSCCASTRWLPWPYAAARPQ